MRNLHLTILLTACTVVKSKVKISQNFVAFSEYLNFKAALGLCVYYLFFLLACLVACHFGFTWTLVELPSEILTIHDRNETMYLCFDL